MQASDVITNLNHFRLVLYFDFASAALVAYDYVLTFGLETRHMWSKQRWSLIRVLFFVNRYMPFVDIPMALCTQLVPSMSDRDCTLVYRLAGWSFCFSIALSEVILAMRTWSLWKASSWSGFALLVFYLSCWIPTIVVFVTFLMASGASHFRLPRYTTCIIAPRNNNLYWCWILVLVYDTGTMMLIVLASTRSYAQMYGQSGSSFMVVRTLYMDGVIYYISLFILSVMNIITIVILPRALVNLFSGLQRTIHATLTSRIVLHLREQVERRATFSDSLVPTLSR